jgi:CubicO group peptidase (beta-lactamase class C family)
MYADVLGSRMATVASRDARAQQVVDAVRSVQAQYGSRAIVYGAWIGGKPLAVGAVGSALPGVPARPDQHFRIGVAAEWFLGTLLLRMADQHKVGLDDPAGKWYPHLPNAHAVTLRMLANSSSGYDDFVTTPAFSKAFSKNPFRQWRPDELIAIAMSKPPLFRPGTSWAFSDTNATILGQILQRVGGKPLGVLYRENLFSKLGMSQTRANPNAIVPAPVLHGYENSRGVYEDSTNWTGTWVPGASNVTSTVGELGRWVRGYGSVLSARSRTLQTAPDLAGKGPLDAQHLLRLRDHGHQRLDRAEPAARGLQRHRRLPPVQEAVVRRLHHARPQGRPGRRCRHGGLPQGRPRADAAEHPGVQRAAARHQRQPVADRRYIAGPPWPTRRTSSSRTR